MTLKVIGTGFGRTGTQSLKFALEQLGFAGCYHMMEVFPRPDHVGVWAKATEPLHWAIYAAGAGGFWKMKSWMWPWAAVYCAQVAIGMVVWSVLDPRGAPWMGFVAGAVFLVPTIALWRARPAFRSSTAEQTVRATATPSR